MNVTLSFSFSYQGRNYLFEMHASLCEMAKPSLSHFHAVAVQKQALAASNASSLLAPTPRADYLVRLWQNHARGMIAKAYIIIHRYESARCRSILLRSCFTDLSSAYGAHFHKSLHRCIDLLTEIACSAVHSALPVARLLSALATVRCMLSFAPTPGASSPHRWTLTLDKTHSAPPMPF